MDNSVKNFNSKGYFVQKNFFEQKFILKILEEIETAKSDKKVDVYLDRNGLPRRLERLYDKGINLNLLNNKISEFLNKVFNKKFLIFKDKFNSKPPGGEGFKAHYDGIFKFYDKNNKEKKGWYEYSDTFVNVLVSLDQSNSKNGTLEISKVHKKNFDDLYSQTLKDGSPNLKQNIEINLKFEVINLNVGDVLIFDNRCPHRSKKNNSLKSRRILYYTYSPEKFGFQYKNYFFDKKKSKNLNKALIGEK